MKIFIAVPCMKSMPSKTVFSMLTMQTVGAYSWNKIEGSLVYDAREKLAERAINSGSDYVLWLDSDMVFTDTLLIDLLGDMDRDHDVVSALCFRKIPPCDPPIWKTLRLGGNEGDIVGYNDYPEDSLFEVEGCGFGAVLMKTEVLETILKEEKMMFIPLIGFGEDVSFCLRARKHGFRLWCDSRIKVGHIADTIVTEETFRALNPREETNADIS